jgi:hypothetical protein
LILSEDSLSNIPVRLHRSRIRVSQEITYNNFPFPSLEGAVRSRVEQAAQSVLEARSAHPGATLGDLYDPLSMPADLVAAHTALDRAVDAAFAPRRRFNTDEDRLQTLFDRYEQLTATLFTPEKTSRTRRQRRS